MNQRVTWLIPIRNGMPYLSETLASIEAQTYKNWQVLAWDNGSTDGTSEELRKWIPERLPGRIVTSIPLTVGASLAQMVEQCETELCARIDVDDINFPDRLEQQIAFLESHPEVVLVGGQMYQIDGMGNIRGKSYPCPSNHDDIVHLCLSYNAIFHPSVLFRRSAILAVGNYQDVPNVEDYDLWLRVASQFKVANLDEFIVEYRVHDRSTTEIALKSGDLIRLTQDCFSKNAPSLYGCSEKDARLLRENQHSFPLFVLFRVAKHLQKNQGGYWLDRFRSKFFIISGRQLTSDNDIISRLIWWILWQLLSE